MTSLGGEHYVDVDGLRTSYIKAGSGHPLLLLHGRVLWRMLASQSYKNIDYFARSGLRCMRLINLGTEIQTNRRITRLSIE